MHCVPKDIYQESIEENQQFTRRNTGFRHEVEFLLNHEWCYQCRRVGDIRYSDSGN